MATAWQSNIPAVLTRLQVAKRDALIVAAQLYVNEMKRRLAGGYTSGDFVTGATVNHVTRTAPRVEPGGEVSIGVGTNLPYNLYWELGFHSIFTRRFERVELWVPTFRALAPQMAQLYSRLVKRSLELA